MLTQQQNSHFYKKKILSEAAILYLMLNYWLLTPYVEKISCQKTRILKGLNLLLWDVFLCCHGPMASADNTEFYIKNIPRATMPAAGLFSPNLSFLSLHCSIICLPSSQIILSGFVLTCYTAIHLGPTLAPSIHHPLTSLHNFLSVTHGALHLFLAFSA